MHPLFNELKLHNPEQFSDFYNISNKFYDTANQKNDFMFNSFFIKHSIILSSLFYTVWSSNEVHNNAFLIFTTIVSFSLALPVAFVDISLHHFNWRQKLAIKALRFLPKFNKIQSDYHYQEKTIEQFLDNKEMQYNLFLFMHTLENNLSQYERHNIESNDHYYIIKTDLQKINGYISKNNSIALAELVKNKFKFWANIAQQYEVNFPSFHLIEKAKIIDSNVYESELEK